MSWNRLVVVKGLTPLLTPLGFKTQRGGLIVRKEGLPVEIQISKAPSYKDGTEYFSGRIQFGPGGDGVSYEENIGWWNFIYLEMFSSSKALVYKEGEEFGCGELREIAKGPLHLLFEKMDTCEHAIEFLLGNGAKGYGAEINISYGQYGYALWKRDAIMAAYILAKSTYDEMAMSRAIEALRRYTKEGSGQRKDVDDLFHYQPDLPFRV